MKFGGILIGLTTAAFILAGCGTAQRYSSTPYDSFDHRGNSYRIANNVADNSLHVRPAFGDMSQRMADEAAASYLATKQPGCTANPSTVFTVDAGVPNYEVSYTCRR